jgi:glycosyltransferase involved in cell wall biosynthesis
MKTKVSIIIPVYRNIHFLKKSLHSAASQTYKNIEILIINDGNLKKDKDEIYRIKNLFKRKNIKVININKNKGVSNALNEGIKKSSGDYISWLSHDDYFDLKKTEMQIKFLKKKNAKICSCDFVEINKLKKFKIDRTLDENYFDDQILSIILNDSLHGCSLIIDKSCFKKFTFNKKYKHIQDYDLWYKMSEKYQFVHLNRKLLFSIKHSSQTSYLKKDESITEKLNFYKDLIDNKLVFYNFKKLSYVLKFIFRSLFMYKSLSLSFSLIKKFVFYRNYNFITLYFNKK